MSDRVRDGYDTVSQTYADRLGDELAGKPLDRALLAAFAEALPVGSRVADLGCGPGHVTAHLAGLGLDPVGIDLSDGMIEQARRRHPGLTFECSSFLDLDPTAGYAGAIAFYSLIHLADGELLDALRRVRSALLPGAPLLMSVHLGDEVRHVADLWGHRVDLDFRFYGLDEVTDALTGAGFVVEYRLERAPYPDVEVETRRGYLLGRAG